MVPTQSTDYSNVEQALLLRIARASITEAVQTGLPVPVDAGKLPPALAENRACFVTLHAAGKLRGCTGSMAALQPLAVDVAQVACRTALADPRFAPVQVGEIEQIAIEISVLSPLVRLPVSSEAELLAGLRPGIDGLVLELGPCRATFLPKVWESLPDPVRFFAELKRKAGLAPDFWSDELLLSRYHTDTFGDATH